MKYLNKFITLTAIGLAGLFATSAMAAEPSHGASAKPAAAHGESAKQVAAVPAHGAAKKSGPPHWTYSGDDGPAKWGDLTPAFRACSLGVQQSPINLHNAIGSDIGDITVSYRSTAFEVVNNGHTIQVNVEDGSTIMLDGVDYKLLQFHFHTPSEHLKDGKPFKMEAHFVHISEKGVLAVLGVFIKPGKTNALLAPIWDVMPSKPGTVKGQGKISPQQLLPSNRSFVRYYGSLTTPPCSEKVIWSVFNEPVEASPGQAGKFSDLFPMNARPAQGLNRRFVLNTK